MARAAEKLILSFKRVIPRRLFHFLQPVYHFLLAFLAALWYWFPSRSLVVIGVTGTKGKTTVVELLDSIFTETGAGVASLSSLRFKIRDRAIENDKKMTMPGRFFIQRFLYDAKRAGCRYVILEVTSQGIVQSRHRFIRIQTAVMTNVQLEHLEAHGGFENYIRAKLDLFWRLPKEGVAVINHDDPNQDRFAAATRAHRIFYGREKIEMNGNTWIARSHAVNDAGIAFDLWASRKGAANGNGSHVAAIRSPLQGEFNMSNILAAIASALAHHIAPEKILSGISRVAGIRGRMEFVQREPFQVVVDYAHTPDSLREVYRYLKKPRHGLVCVLGSAGGGRDRWKRKELGRIAAEFCSKIILTNEDPYDENPERILNDIEVGIPKGKTSAAHILDRRQAIHEALLFAKKGDSVIMTGKGAEPWIMGVNGTKTPWNEIEAVREELTRIKGEKGETSRGVRKREHRQNMV